MVFVDTVSVGEVSMRYAKFGEGKENFVVLPGVSTKYVTDSAARVEHLYSKFTEKYTVYLFDRRENLPENMTVRQMAEDTVNVMKFLGVEKADIFGASQGGMIAQNIAVFYPDTVSRLVLASSVMKFSSQAARFFTELSEQIEIRNRRGLSEVFAKYVYSKATVEKYGEALLYVNDGLTDGELLRFKAQLKAAVTPDMDKLLGKIKCPTFVIGSRDDKIFSEEEQRELAEKIGCEIFLYSGYGHAVYDEASDFTDKVFEFLTSAD